MAPGKSPEEWEAGEHIDNLNRGIGADLDDPMAHGHAHDDVNRALVWMIRRMDNASTWPGAFVAMAKGSPFVVVGLCVVAAAALIARSRGVDVPFLP